MTIVAAFDFDGTLTTRDTVVPFLRRFTSVPRLAVSLLPHSVDVVPAVVGRDRDRLRDLATRSVFRDRPLDDVEAEAASHGERIVREWLRPDTLARLRWHLDHDHRVVIVSASYEHYVRVVARQLGTVAVLATRLDVAGGRCTGALRGPNCRGPEKVRRLDAWLSELSLDRRGVTLYAYGDSSGDRELLAAADHPHWVDEPLASVAPTA